MDLLKGTVCHECFINIVQLTKLTRAVKKEAGKPTFVKDGVIAKGLPCSCKALMSQEKAGVASHV